MKPAAAIPNLFDARAERAFDVELVRDDFPILRKKVNDHQLVYLDNAATTQKPAGVLEAMNNYYVEENSNIHRGVHFLSDRATQSYEAARVKVQRWINAAHAKEIIFTRGTTESINLVASSFAGNALRENDEIVLTAMEHHSNIVPWQIVCSQRRAHLRVVPMNERGELLLEEYEKLLTPRVKLAALCHISNALGTVNPVKQMIEAAHAKGIAVLIDGAQAVPHMKPDMRDLDADFYAFSAHKMYGPTGVGILYGKESFLQSMPPYQGGGDMIKSVTFEKTIYNDLPNKFEAGTPNIAGGIGFGAAIDYLSRFDFGTVAAYEHALLVYATDALSGVKGLTIIGTAREKVGVISFILEGIHPHDIGTILDDDGIAIRTGHHCAQPVMDRFGIPATARASFGIYNTKSEVDALVRGIEKAIGVFS